MRVFIDDALAFEETTTLRMFDMWNVCDIAWPSRAVTVLGAITSMQPD